MAYAPDIPGLRASPRTSFPRPNAGGAERTRSDYTNKTRTFTAKSHRLYFQGVAPGGGTGSSNSTTVPPGASGAGESAIGSIPVVKGKRYTVTIGTAGAGAAAVSTGIPTTHDGTDGGDLILKGPGVLLVLKGGKKGLGSGTGGDGGGADDVSPLGYETFKGGDGGDSVTSNIGQPGTAAVSSVPGGTPGAGSPSGPGGGGSVFGRGGNGGSATAAGNQSPDVDSGAGSGAPGASGDGFTGAAGAAGRGGSFRWWWNE